MTTGRIQDNDSKKLKVRGAFYTPDEVVNTLIRWAVRSEKDRLLDPACGDGRFVAAHKNSVGVEQDFESARVAMTRAPGALIHEGEFFFWAANTDERFDCAAGNPPFIRYQTFNGETRREALSLCSLMGVKFSGLTSSWAPFLVATASLLRPGGRMAFVVPAEIGHAPYATPLIEYLVRKFRHVQVIAVREKMFPELSEDCWLLYADGFGDSTQEVILSAMTEFESMSHPPRKGTRVQVSEWRNVWGGRLRPFLLPQAARDIYSLSASEGGVRIRDVAKVGIGYVTGANDFFHLSPSEAEARRIPDRFLLPSVRNGRMLEGERLSPSIVDKWRRRDLPVLLLNLPKSRDLPKAVMRYLDTDAGKAARQSYKCRNRSPWYSVPDVVIPDFFLSYMSGIKPSLVENNAKCCCTNSVHAVVVKRQEFKSVLRNNWDSPLAQLSCELEGHPLGGGLLKLEPGEAQRVLVKSRIAPSSESQRILDESISLMRAWRHYEQVG
ncbi:MAG TPA: N-6 DNA methylase [Candidatus Kryptobacter bacterium]|nr:N-6 DNA methylase [Candidatus Kryptobacter bacterium]